MGSLERMRVAILVDNGFEHLEMIEPRKALESAGAKTVIVSPQPETVKAWDKLEWGKSYPVQDTLEMARADQYDALLLPGGVMSPDHLRMNPDAVKFVKAFFDADKPVAAICHGPWTIIEAGVARGRKIASWPSLKTDLKNAGAEWVDKETVVDGNLVSSRKPDDIPAFNREMLDLFARRQRRGQSA